MSFTEIAPREDARRYSRETLELCVGKRFGAAAGVEMRLSLLRDALDGADFLQFGTKVKVLEGRDDHLGWLRFAPGGQHRVLRPGGRVSRALLIGFPLPACVLDRIARFAVDEFEASEGFLLVRIPDDLVKASAARDKPPQVPVPTSVITAPPQRTGVIAAPPPAAPVFAKPPIPSAPFRSAIADVPHNVRRGT